MTSSIRVAAACLLLLVLVLQAPTPAQAFAVHQGCFVTAQGGVRALPFKAADSSSMTIEACRSMALARAVSVFALEAGTQCWLDPLNGNLTYLTRFGAGAACNTACAGNSRVVCGGQQQANLYFESSAVAVPPNDYTAVGCYKDDAASRRLTLVWVANNSMTVDLCANVAFKEEYKVFGVQGGSECWAGQDIDAARALGTSSSCSTLCPGASSQSCGGTLALNLYTVQSAPWLLADNTQAPKSLTASASACVGAAASSAGCQAPPASAAAPVQVNHLLAAAAALVATALVLKP